MTTEQKQLNRWRFVKFTMFYIVGVTLLGFALSYLGKDVAGFATVTGSIAVALTGGLVANFATKPAEAPK